MMSRTYATVPGLSYGDLDAALQNIGDQREDQRDKVLHTHPDDPKARLVFTPVESQESVRDVDLFAARQIADSFGIFDPKNFDLPLVRVTEGQKSALAQQANDCLDSARWSRRKNSLCRKIGD